MSADEAPIPELYLSAHKARFRCRPQLEASRWVGCFYCLMIFRAKSIREWIDDNQTALCPVCQVDSVMPLTAEQFDSDFLPEMRRYWFTPGGFKTE